MKPSKHKMKVLSQICKLILGYMVNKLTEKHRVDKQARTFSPVDKADITRCKLLIHGGLTLIELLIAISVIAILA